MNYYRKLIPIEYNNKKFMIFLDENKKRTFLEIGPAGDYIYPLLEDYLSLYKIFNIQDPFICYDISKFKFQEKVRIIKGGVVSLLTVITILNNIPSALAAELNTAIEGNQITISETLSETEEKYEYIEINDLKDLDQYLGVLNVTKEMVLEAINNNSNLNTKYKKIATTLLTEITSNYPDFNLRIFYENIKDMEVTEYTIEEFRQVFPEAPGAGAQYNAKTNKITTINEIPIGALYHEMHHATYSLYHQEENKIIYRLDSNTSLEEAMTDVGASLVVPVKNGYILDGLVLNYFRSKTDFTLNDYNNKGIEGLITKLEIKYPDIDFDYISEALNTANSNLIYLGKYSSIDKCGEMLTLLFKMSLDDASLSSGYQPFNEFAKLFYIAKDPALVFEYLEKYNEKLISLGYTNIISKEDAMEKYFTYKDVDGIGVVNDEYIPIIYNEGNTETIDEEGNRRETKNHPYSCSSNFSSAIIATMFSNYEIFGTNEYWKTVSEEYSIISPHRVEEIPIYQNGKLLTTSKAQELILKIGVTKDNTIGFVLNDARTNEIIYKTSDSLDYESNYINLEEYIFSFSDYINELELNDVLNDDYLLNYQTRTGRFYNLRVENKELNIEPLYMINIENDLYIQRFVLSSCVLSSNNGIISIKDTGISIESSIPLENKVTLRDILAKANVLDPAVLLYNYNEEEITKMIKNYLNDLSIEMGR